MIPEFSLHSVRSQTTDMRELFVSLLKYWVTSVTSHTRSRRGHKNGNFLPIDLRTRYVLAYLPGDEPGIKCGSSRCCPVEPWSHLLLQAFSCLRCQAYRHRVRQVHRRLLSSAIGCAKPTSVYELTAIECVKLTAICWANFLGCLPSDGRCAKLIASDAPNF